MFNGYNWQLFFDKSDVYTMTVKYCKMFDEGKEDAFCYTLEDTHLLNKIQSEMPEPEFTGNAFTRQAQLKEYGDRIREEFKRQKEST